MSDLNFYLIMASAALAGVTIIVLAGLSGWRSWLALKQQQLRQDADARTPMQPSTTARIELADLKERIRKLEAIAAGVDL